MAPSARGLKEYGQMARRGLRALPLLVHLIRGRASHSVRAAS
jgi:hypothetical protein